MAARIVVVRRPAPPKPVIRADIHERFLIVAARSDAKAAENLAAIRDTPVPLGVQPVPRRRQTYPTPSVPYQDGPSGWGNDEGW